MNNDELLAKKPFRRKMRATRVAPSSAVLPAHARRSRRKAPRRVAMPASAADAPAGANSNPSVWYASFGSNILSERFACYLEGGRIEGMIRDMPGSRDPSPPTEWRRWDDLPHRLFFAHSSPTWDGGGVAFVDFGEDLAVAGDAPETPSRDISSVAPEAHRSALGVSYRLYRVTLEQFNDVLAQENGMVPGDEACREMTAEEARALADAWTALVPETRAVNGAAHAGCLTSASASDAGGRPALRNGFRVGKRRPTRRNTRALRAVVRLRQVHRRFKRRAGVNLQLRRGDDATIQNGRRQTQRAERGVLRGD
jgi:hypothetical protein